MHFSLTKYEYHYYQANKFSILSLFSVSIFTVSNHEPQWVLSTCWSLIFAAIKFLQLYSLTSIIFVVGGNASEAQQVVVSLRLHSAWLSIFTLLTGECWSYSEVYQQIRKQLFSPTILKFACDNIIFSFNNARNGLKETTQQNSTLSTAIISV